MARRRRFGRRSRSSSRGSSGVMGGLLGAALYTVARPYIVNLVKPVSGMIPGNVGDNVVLGVGAAFLEPKTSGVIKDALKAAVTIETALGVNDLMTGQMNGGGAPQTFSASAWAW